MSGSYPPPGGADPYGEPDPYGGASGGGWRPPGGPDQPPTPHPGYPPPGGRAPGYGEPRPPEAPQAPPAQPYHGWPYGRPDFIPPEQVHYAPQTWGEWQYGPTLGHPGWMPPDEGIQTNGIFALVASIVTLMCCSNVFALGGITCSIIALTRWQQQPESARTLNTWAWVCTGGGLVLVVLIWLGLFLLPFIPLLGMGGV